MRGLVKRPDLEFAACPIGCVWACIEVSIDFANGFGRTIFVVKDIMIIFGGFVTNNSLSWSFGVRV